MKDNTTVKIGINNVNMNKNKYFLTIYDRMINFMVRSGM